MQPARHRGERSDVLPNYSEYKAAVEATANLRDSDPTKTPPIEFGRMEPTSSDPAVQQQYGMTVGIPNAGQVRALAMLNIRGERSVTCKGDFDKHPVGGPAAAEAPPVCEEFRRQPDALERAAELDAQYGRNPDLAAMPMYCIPFSFKDPYDTKDMRSTGGADARYDMDFPARDQTLVAQLRHEGRDHLRQGEHDRIQRPRTRRSGRRELPDEGAAVDARAISAAPGPAIPCNSYDTTRAASIGSSSGSGVSVSTNLVMCSLCEETGQSCRGPANHNSVALILPHKAHAVVSTAAPSAPRSTTIAPGIHCRTISDAAKVLDALKDPVERLLRPARHLHHRAAVEPLDRALCAARSPTAAPGALKGMRIGIIREFMVKHAKVDEPIVDAAAAEMKAMLGGHLGATLVESVTAGLGGRSRHREHDDVVRSGDRAAGAGALPGFALSAQRRQGAGVSGVRRQESSRRRSRRA